MSETRGVVFSQSAEAVVHISNQRTRKSPRVASPMYMPKLLWAVMSNSGLDIAGIRHTAPLMAFQATCAEG